MGRSFVTEESLDCGQVANPDQEIRRSTDARKGSKSADDFLKREEVNNYCPLCPLDTVNVVSSEPEVIEA